MKEFSNEIAWNWKTFWMWFWIVVVITGAAFAFGWITLPVRKGSVQNVETQFTFGYSQINSLKATASSICLAQKAVDSENNPDLKSQRMSQLLAYQANYNRLAADYDAWSENIFTGKVIRPADLPLRAPPLPTCSQ